MDLSTATDGFHLDSVFTLLVAKENVIKKLSFAQHAMTMYEMHDKMTLDLEVGDMTMFGRPASTRFSHGVPRTVAVVPKTPKHRNFAVTWQQRRTIKDSGIDYWEGLKN